MEIKLKSERTQETFGTKAKTRFTIVSEFLECTCGNNKFFLSHDIKTDNSTGLKTISELELLCCECFKEMKVKISFISF